ncbi:MAG: SDR family NAD(P)-dependent oxidoreductase [Clostridia bacterium]|nr:SDR family NAD(P)-dependent oxidoreductase [Clostridia bacterium]
MNIEKWLSKNTLRLDGKKVAISGSTGGLGRELCKYIVQLGGELILIDRNSERSLAFAGELKESYPDLMVSNIKADMSDIESVRDAADRLSEMEIDYLILNAGAYSIPRYTCDNGYDNVFQINFISPYYLARRLLPVIECRGGKLVAVSSIAHNYSKIDEGDIDFSTRKQASLVYGNAKRYLTYSLFALNSPSLSVTHPGISFTGITNHYPKLIFALIKHPMKVIFPRPRMACLSILKGLFTDCNIGEWIGPSILDVWGRPRKKSLKTASTREGAKIAKIAEEIYKKTNINP